MKIKSIKDLEESIISTIKSISKNEKIDVEFDLENIDFQNLNQNNFTSDKKISLPKINNGSLERLQLVRATSDLAALYLAFHKKKIHQQYNFENNLEQKLFDDFEKFRLIIKGAHLFKGVGINTTKLIESAIDEIASKAELLPLLLLKELPVKSEKIKKNLAVFEKILSEDLAKKINSLEKLIDNQKEFAKASIQIIELFKSFQDKLNSENKTTSTEKSGENSKQKNSVNSEEKLENETKKIKSSIPKEVASGKDYATSQTFDILEKDLSESENNSRERETESQPTIKFIPEYKIFTKKYDQIIKAEDLSNKAELVNLRHQLDIKLSKLGNISNRLTGKLKRKLLSKKNVFYEYNKEEGIIDRKKISKIITNPLSANNYVTINQDQYQDTVISLLLDNSGSMRGTPIVMSAMVSEIIAKILEGFNIKTEILGFTTCDWRGGKSRKLWETSGKPANPGRLSDLRHIIYKNANQSFKKSKINLGLMLKEGILKENIDGEALIWAKDRLINRNEQRKIIMVISDGTPVDDSTNSNNDHPILSDHLHQVIAKLEKHSGIEIAAIGIGHNINDYYRNSITINNIEELGDVMIDKICGML